MEVYEIHLLVTHKFGKKWPFTSKPTFAMTGFEASEKTRIFILSKFKDVETCELLYWKVLNPFKAHFLTNPIFIPPTK